MKLRLMIADDEWIIREGLIHGVPWLDLDIEVVAVAANGLEALEKVKGSGIQILLTDIRMPGIDGLELIRQIHAENIRIRTIILSGYSDFSYAQHAIKLGVRDFLLKPLDESELIETVKKLAAEIREEQKDLEAKRNFHLLDALRGQQQLTNSMFKDLDINWRNYMVVCWEGNDGILPILKQEGFKAIELNINKESGILVIHDIEKRERLQKSLNSFFMNQSMFGGCSEVQEDLSFMPASYKKAILALEWSKKTNEFGCTFFDNNTVPLNIDHILDYIVSHYSEAISLQLLAEKHYISESYLSRIFKQYTGKKFIDYLTEIRIDKAKELLIYSSLKTNEIANAAGYTDQRYFSQIFKKVTGMTPSEFKQNAKKTGIDA